MHRVIARQHQMIAIVDHLPMRGIEIGAAAPARLRRRLDQLDRRAARRQDGGGRQPGQPAADDIGLAVIRAS